MNWWKQAPRLVSLALAMAIAGDVALTYSRLHALGQHIGDRTDPLNEPHRTTRATPKDAEVRQIVAAHLFGAAPRVHETLAAVSRTQWVLTGVINTQDPHAGFAFIGPNETAARVVPVGQEVTRGVMVREIYADHVIIDLGDHLETLRIRLYDSSGSRKQTPATISASAPQDANTEVSQDPDDEFAPPPMNNDGAVWAALSVRPKFSGTQRVGARISATGVAARAMAALGLDSGDLIVDVNGVPGGGNLQYALSQISDGDPLTLMVDRGGTDVPVTINARQIAAAADIYRAGQ